LANEGIFELGVSLKGGTAIRKFRAGNAGRFSTDLDFAGMNDAAADLLVEVVDGATVSPFEFALEPLDGTRRMRLSIASPFGETEVPARLDLGRRALWLPTLPGAFRSRSSQLRRLLFANEEPATRFYSGGGFLCLFRKSSRGEPTSLAI
jgi:hypothetical protein